MTIKLRTRTAIAALVIAGLSGCASSPGYENAFNGRPSMHNTREYAVSQNTARAATEKTLAERGFQIVHESRRRITATNNYKKEAGSDTTYRINADIGMTEIGPETTQVSMTANQETIVHQKSHTWFHFLFIPIIPTGTLYQKHVTDSGAITQEKFYSGFYDSLNENLSAQDPA